MLVLKSVAVGLLVAMLVWAVGMFVSWELYGFWETSRLPGLGGAWLTRWAMLWFGAGSGFLHYTWRATA